MRGQAVSAQTIRRTLHQIGLHGCRPRRKTLLKMMHKKADVACWNHILWSDETKITLFGSDGVKGVWQQPGEEYKDKCVLPTVKHGAGSVMVWGCISAANMYCNILKQSMMPFGDWAAGQYSNMITTRGGRVHGKNSQLIVINRETGPIF